MYTYCSCTCCVYVCTGVTLKLQTSTGIYGTYTRTNAVYKVHTI